MDTSLDMDSMNLLQEMEDISNALKKQQLEQLSNSETITDINQLINNENNISSDDDISNMPVSNFKNNSIQKERLTSISNAIQNNKISRYQSTDNESEIFVSAKEDFVTASEQSETDLDRSDEDMFSKQRKKSSSTELKKEHMKMRINSFNSDIFNKRLFSMNSDILSHVTISDQKGNNSRQVSQEVSNTDKEEHTLMLDEQTQDVTKMLQRIDTGLENNHIVMDSDNSKDSTSYNNTLDSDGDFNSSFSLKIANKSNDAFNASDIESVASVKYSKFENDIKNNSDLRMSSNDEKRSISSSSNKFKTNRIISPSQIVQLSPNLPSFSSFENSFAVFDYSIHKDTRRSEYKDVMNRIVSSEIEYPKTSVNNSQLDQSRNVLRNLRRRVTSDILKAEVSDSENTIPQSNNNFTSNRIASSHSLLSEMNKLWDSAISDTAKEEPTNDDDKLKEDSNNENKISHIWKNENSSLTNLDVDAYKQSEMVKRTLKNSDDHVIQRTSTGLGIYHNLELIKESSDKQKDAFMGSASSDFAKEETGKKVIIGNVQDLLLQNGISLHDIKFDQESIKPQKDEIQFEKHDVLPQTPKESSNDFKKMKVSSPVKVVNREIVEKKPLVAIEQESEIDKNNEFDGKKRVLKLKNNELSNLGYLYISLNTLSLSNFINKSYPNMTFADKKAELQILFDNGKKIIESEWIPLTNINSGSLGENIDISSQEYMTEIPIKDTLDGYDDIVSSLQFTFKMRYDQPKNKVVEIQDRIPIIQSNKSNTDEPRTNSFTKKIFNRKGKTGSSNSNNSSIFTKAGRRVEYQTVIKKVEQKVQDPWSTNFSPDGETFGLFTAQLSFSDICLMTNILNSKKGDVLATSSFNNANLLKNIGSLDFKILHLSHVNNVVPKSISAISEIINRKEKILSIKFDRHGIMYQQGLDVPESSGVRRRKFVLENGLLNAYNVDDSEELKISINLENVNDILLDCESCPAPGFNFEMVFDDKSRVVLSCDTINQRKMWLNKIKEVLDVLRVVRELDIEIK
ncbi:hypothetical protein FOG51_03801 [Hanseniaspora uvarum]|nr:hypothetical protein FOG51_03801 [Hanseniaspora uvarum]